MPLGASELILNPDRSIYHLNLLPEDLADTVITVGDPDRVKMVSKYFDHIEIRKGKREFITHTGTLNRRRITVISTGIGTDNVDIVLNELDALANIDFSDRMIKSEKRNLTVVRLGTSGALQPEIATDSFLVSQLAMGLDGLLHYYDHQLSGYKDVEEAFMRHNRWPDTFARPYVVGADPELAKKFGSAGVLTGFTATLPGFYGSQGRRLRLVPSNANILRTLSDFKFKGLTITNLEMETAGIYALCNLLGHSAISINCILANRVTSDFSKNPEKSIDRLIRYVLHTLCEGEAL